MALSDRQERAANLKLTDEIGLGNEVSVHWAHVAPVNDVET